MKYSEKLKKGWNLMSTIQIISIVIGGFLGFAANIASKKLGTT
jgi:hypothetical protein